MKHTPGPWKVVALTVCSEDGRVLADVNCACTWDSETLGESLSNAYLMADAPELLAALRGLHKAFKELSDQPGYYYICPPDCVDEAVSKAKSVLKRLESTEGQQDEKDYKGEA